MPPKKKKGSKKTGKKNSGKKGDNEITLEDIEIGEPELNKSFYLLRIKDLERKLGLYKGKAAKFQTENDEFMKRQKELSQKKHDLISFLEKNLLNRGDEFSDLKDRYFGLQQAKEAEKNQFESTLQEIRSKLQESKDQLTAENSLLNAKLAALEEFKVQKEKYLEEYAQLEQVLAGNKADHEGILESIQVKCDNQHDRLKKEIVSKINLVAADFRKISQKQTSETTKRTIRENVSIRTQLVKMDDKNIELMQENERLRLSVKESLIRMKELDRTNTDLAGKNLSHIRLLHFLMVKDQEHKNMLLTYQKETEIIQQMAEENENSRIDMEKMRDDIQNIGSDNNFLRDAISVLNQDLEDIKEKTNEARKALIEAVHKLKELLQSIPSTTTSCSSKSSNSSMSKRTTSQASIPQLSKADLKEWGDLQTRTIAQEKLKCLLDALDFEESDSRASSASVTKKPSRNSTGYGMSHSASVSIATKNASAIKRLSPELKEPSQMNTKPKIKILSDYEIKTQAKLHALQQNKGFCVPGLLQMVPHMSRHIPTNMEKTYELNKRLIGMNIYSGEEDIDKPIKSTLLGSLDNEKRSAWTNKLSS